MADLLYDPNDPNKKLTDPQPGTPAANSAADPNAPATPATPATPAAPGGVPAAMTQRPLGKLTPEERMKRRQERWAARGKKGPKNKPPLDPNSPAGRAWAARGERSGSNRWEHGRGRGFSAREGDRGRGFDDFGPGRYDQAGRGGWKERMRSERQRWRESARVGMARRNTAPGQPPAQAPPAQVPGTPEQNRKLEQGKRAMKNKGKKKMPKASGAYKAIKNGKKMKPKAPTKTRQRRSPGRKTR